MLEVGDDADDGEPVRTIGVGELEATADGIGIRPQLFGHGLIDERDGSPGDLVGVAEIASAEERDADGLRNAWCRGDEIHLRFLAALDVAALDLHLPAATAVAERDEIRGERRLDPGDSIDPTRNVLDSPRFRFGRLVARARQIKPHRHQRRRVEADRSALQVEEAADEQGGAERQHQRHRHLGHDQRVAHPVRGGRRRPRPPSFKLDCRLTRAACSAGAIPNTRPVPIEMPMV